MEEHEDDITPEVFRLHSALAVAILALELIRDLDNTGGSMAKAALDHLRRRHPVSHPFFAEAMAEELENRRADRPPG